jgi:hypothetical protein
MSKRRKEKPEAGAPGAAGAAERLAARVAQGDNRSARAQARQILADAGSSATDRAVAEEILARTGIDKGALLTAALAIAVILVIAALVYLR